MKDALINEKGAVMKNITAPFDVVRKAKEKLSAQQLEAQAVGDHRDKFAVSGFAPTAGNGAAKILLDHGGITSAPGGLDGVTDRPLYLGAGGAKLPGDGRIKAFCHRAGGSGVYCI